MNKIWLWIILLIASSCGPGSNQGSVYQLSSEDQAKFEKYLILGQSIYKENCASCHQKNGQGLRGIIPPLAQSDYLEKSQLTIPCLLRFGTKDTIMVNGKTYPPKMPAHTISNLEMAEVLTYINNTWGNTYGFVQVKELDSLLSACQ